jgi:hypothetical protein
MGPYAKEVERKHGRNQLMNCVMIITIVGVRLNSVLIVSVKNET